MGYIGRHQSLNGLNRHGEIVRQDVMEDNLVDEGSQAESSDKMITQSHADALVKKAKWESAEKARRELRAEIEAERAQGMQGMQANNQSAPTGQSPVDVNEIKRQAQEGAISELERRQAEQAEARQLQEMAAQYYRKMESVPELFEDLAKFNDDFTKEFPEIALFAGTLENTAHVLKELDENPHKLAAINSFTKSAPQRAVAELKKLDASITANRSAGSNAKTTNQPLSKLKSSNIGGMDAGPKSISDLRKMKYLKG